MDDEQMVPDEGKDAGAATDSFPTYEPPPPPKARPDEGVQPAWAGATPARRSRSRRSVALAVIGTLVVLLGVPAALIWTPAGNLVSALFGDSETDLREGGVFLHSNDAKVNEVVAFARAEDGTLREVGRYPTGGKGSGSFEDSSTGVILASAEGEASPIQNVDSAEFLFVPNAGSSTISVFRVESDELELVEEVPAGGEKPVSMTVNNGVLYVLNSGEFDDRLFTYDGLEPDGGALENCTHGQLPSVTGFRVSEDGELTKINGSTRLLSEQAESGCAQVSFTPDGQYLVVAERIAGKPGSQPPGGFPKGGYTVFSVGEDGTLGPKKVLDPTGNGPFGFTFTKEGVLLATEQNGAFENPGGGYVASYKLNAAGEIEAVGKEVDTVTTDPCWIVVTGDSKYAFVSAFDGNISSMAVSETGSMSLINPTASADDGEDTEADNAPVGISDIALSRDSDYLYALNSDDGKVRAFKVNENGSLSFIEDYPVFDLVPTDRGGLLAPFGIAAY